MGLDGFLEIVREETRSYRRLLRLLHRQRHYLMRRDTRRLARLSEELANRVPRSRRLAVAREAYLGRVARKAGVDPAQVDLQILAVGADPSMRESVRQALADLAMAGAELYRRNLRNHHLATVSLDLVQEELAHLVGQAGETPGYSSDGEADASPGQGVVDGRA